MSSIMPEHDWEGPRGRLFVEKSSGPNSEVAPWRRKNRNGTIVISVAHVSLCNIVTLRKVLCTATSSTCRTGTTTVPYSALLLLYHDGLTVRYYPYSTYRTVRLYVRLSDCRPKAKTPQFHTTKTAGQTERKMKNTVVNNSNLHLLDFPVPTHNNNGTVP